MIIIDDLEFDIKCIKSLQCFKDRSKHVQKEIKYTFDDSSDEPLKFSDKDCSTPKILGQKFTSVKDRFLSLSMILGSEDDAKEIALKRNDPKNKTAAEERARKRMKNMSDECEESEKESEESEVNEESVKEFKNGGRKVKSKRQEVKARQRMKMTSGESEEPKESEESEVNEESEKEYKNLRSAVKEEKKELLDLLLNQWDNGNSLNLSGNGNSMNMTDNDDF